MNANETDPALSRADAREAALLAVMSKYRITLPRNAPDWRVPPEPLRGTIRGITRGSVLLLCTDGIVGWFAYSDDTIFLGHLQHFVSDKPTTFFHRSAKRSLTPDEKLQRRVAKLQAKLAALLGGE